MWTKMRMRMRMRTRPATRRHRASAVPAPRCARSRQSTLAGATRSVGCSRTAASVHGASVHGARRSRSRRRTRSLIAACSGACCGTKKPPLEGVQRPRRHARPVSRPPPRRQRRQRRPPPLRLRSRGLLRLLEWTRALMTQTRSYRCSRDARQRWRPSVAVRHPRRLQCQWHQRRRRRVRRRRAQRHRPCCRGARALTALPTQRSTCGAALLTTRAPS